ncbi:MAG: hypothetical protein IT378_26500 [Sandaracinaceae bacterium]|nr:hypothetical protein [Sandaracinaceae bacterium]MCC6877889.1 hypothetical protein [Sandaracinaceae bacterium]
MAEPLIPLVLDSREERVVSGLARWMGLLGRFQVVAATFVFLLLLAVGALVSSAELLEPVTRAQAGEEPLVTIGEISREGVAITVAVAVAFCLVFFRGGVLLIGAGEDLEAVMAREVDRSSLQSALSRLRRYFILECALLLAIAALAYLVVFGWPGAA